MQPLDDTTIPTPTRQNPVGAWWKLVRGGNVFISGVATLVGYYLVHRQLDLTTALWIPWAPMLITAAGNMQNDLRDRLTDRLSHPDRPLVSGAISHSVARTGMSILYLGGLGAAMMLSSIALAIAGIVVLGLTLYNYRLSRGILAGNLAVAIMGALPILYGGLCVANIGFPRLPVVVAAALIAFWLHLARELLKDVIDIEGDRAAGRRTLPMIIGETLAIRFGALTMIVAAGFVIWPAVINLFGVLYVFGIAVTIVPSLLLGAAQCWFRPVNPIASIWASWLKVIMLAGLVWMTLGVTP